MRELAEMLDPNDHDSIFDVAKFEQRFDFGPTPCDAGIRETVQRMRTAPGAP